MRRSAGHAQKVRGGEQHHPKQHRPKRGDGGKQQAAPKRRSDNHCSLLPSSFGLVLLSPFFLRVIVFLPICLCRRCCLSPPTVWIGCSDKMTCQFGKCLSVHSEKTHKHTHTGMILERPRAPGSPPLPSLGRWCCVPFISSGVASRHLLFGWCCFAPRSLKNGRCYIFFVCSFDTWRCH